MVSCMMHDLKPHPTSDSLALDRMTASIALEGDGGLRLRYEAEGRIGLVIVPGKAAPERTDHLWETTCFELFLRDAAGNDYCEFNFSPSGQWAAYEFDGYRSGMAPLELTAEPEIVVTADRTALVMDVTLALEMPPLCDVALTAVVEEIGGLKSYWALAHGAERPDFHHPAGFTLQIG